jgi:hypothetical protein
MRRKRKKLDGLGTMRLPRHRMEGDGFVDDREKKKY